MTPRRAASTLACIVVPIFLAGCLDVDTTTTVRRDGSLNRTVVIKGDSSAIYEGHYTIHLDSTWAQDIQKAGEQKYELTASREFTSADALNEATKGEPGRFLSFSVTVDENFRWFTSQLTYRETIHRYLPIDEVPVTDYISPAEIDQFIKHEVLKQPYATAGDSLSLTDASDRFEEWSRRNIFSAYYRIFMDGVRELDASTLTPSYVQAHKDTLYAVFAHIDSKQKEVQQEAFQRLLKSPAVAEVYRLRAVEFDALSMQLEFADEVSANSYKTSVVMPGIIIDTNAPTLEGNRAEWKDYMGVAYVMDFDLWVTSQVINWWAVILTGVVVLGGFILLLVAPLRRRSRNHGSSLP